MTHGTNTLASWGELVPDTGPMTVDEFAALPEDDGWLYELVEGRLVRMPSPGGEHGEIALALAAALYNWVMSHQLGSVLAAETGFQLGPRTALAGDVAYVRAGRAPARGSTDRKKAWRLAPDLVAEVASSSQKADAMEAKARVWVGAGVRLVWVVWPDAQQVDVWRADAAGAARLVTTLKASAGDSLDGLDVLPGFTYPLASLFI